MLWGFVPVSMELNVCRVICVHIKPFTWRCIMRLLGDIARWRSCESRTGRILRPDDSERAALHDAAVRGYGDVVKALLEKMDGY